MKRHLVFLTLFIWSHVAFGFTCGEPDVGNLSELQKILEAPQENPPFRDVFCRAFAICSTCYGSAECLNKHAPDGTTLDPTDTEIVSCDGPLGMKKNLNMIIENRKIGDCGLTDEEKAILYHYTGGGYGCMNTYLRSGVKHAAMEDLVNTLNGALNKLPNYRGLVIRGATLPEKIRKLHQVGAKVMYDAFTSTSTSSGFGGTDIFIMLSKTGKPIMGFSGFEHEYEVLFKARTVFKVLHSYKVNDVHYHVMKEVVKESKQAELAGDKKALSVVKSLQEKGMFNHKDQPDSWMCPLDKAAEKPAQILQKNIPKFVPQMKSGP